MSNGRIELGLGAAGSRPSTTRTAWPFPPVKERFDRLEEQLAIVTGLWTTPPGETFSSRASTIASPIRTALPKPPVPAATHHRRWQRSRCGTPELALDSPTSSTFHPLAGQHAQPRCLSPGSARHAKTAGSGPCRSFSVAQTVAIGRNRRGGQTPTRWTAIGRRPADSSAPPAHSSSSSAGSARPAPTRAFPPRSGSSVRPVDPPRRHRRRGGSPYSRYG
jgi:hypothetical protein